METWGFMEGLVLGAISGAFGWWIVNFLINLEECAECKKEIILDLEKRLRGGL